MIRAAELLSRPGQARMRQVAEALVFALLVVAALAVPQFTDRRDTLNLFFLVFLYITLAKSWNILGGYAGQVNLGHAAFFGIGALTTRELWIEGVPFFASFFAGGVVAVGFAFIVGLPTFRLRGVYFAIGTLAMAEAVRITVGNLKPGISALPVDAIVAYDLTPRYYLALVLAVAAVGAAYLLSRSRWSLGIMALREDEEAASATGVNILQHKLVALGLSSFFAGLAGGTFAYYHVSYYPSLPFSPIWTFDAVLATFVGGVGTLLGPVIGAAAFVFVRERLAVELVDVHQLIFGVLFILVVLLLPGGLVEAWSRIQRLLRLRRTS